MAPILKSSRLTYLGAWLVAATYMYCLYLAFLPWRVVMVEITAHFASWAAIAWLVIPWIQRFPLRLHLGSVAFHLTLGIGFAVVNALSAHFVICLIKDANELNFIESVPDILQNCFHPAFLTYVALIGVVQGREAIRRAHASDLKAEEHKLAFVHAQLQSLKIQLQPHFLFNTLNSIASLMHYDLTTADRMLHRLSDLLRLSLQEGDKPSVSLQREIAFAQAYVDIEKIRFQERLQVTWQIPEALHDHPVPPFVLQPLLENAIKYGVAPHAAGGRIVVRAAAAEEWLTLEVENDTSMKKAQDKGFGIGLANTRLRLEALYGERQALDLFPSADGTIARIRIPLAVVDVVEEATA